MTSILFSQLTTAFDLGNEIDFITQYFFLEKKHVCFSWKIKMSGFETYEPVFVFGTRNLEAVVWKIQEDTER